jgi:hypothetical protein
MLLGFPFFTSFNLCLVQSWFRAPALLPNGLYTHRIKTHSVRILVRHGSLTQPFSRPQVSASRLSPSLSPLSFSRGAGGLHPDMGVRSSHIFPRLFKCPPQTLAEAGQVEPLLGAFSPWMFLLVDTTLQVSQDLNQVGIR